MGKVDIQVQGGTGNVNFSNVENETSYFYWDIITYNILGSSMQHNDLIFAYDVNWSPQQI